MKNTALNAAEKQPSRSIRKLTEDLLTSDKTLHSQQNNLFVLFRYFSLPKHKVTGL